MRTVSSFSFRLETATAAMHVVAAGNNLPTVGANAEQLDNADSHWDAEDADACFFLASDHEPGIVRDKYGRPANMPSSQFVLSSPASTSSSRSSFSTTSSSNDAFLSTQQRLSRPVYPTATTIPRPSSSADIDVMVVSQQQHSREEEEEPASPLQLSDNDANPFRLPPPTPLPPGYLDAAAECLLADTALGPVNAIHLDDEGHILFWTAVFSLRKLGRLHRADRGVVGSAASGSSSGTRAADNVGLSGFGTSWHASPPHSGRIPGLDVDGLIDELIDELRDS